jgi:SAM-dependent methyltransferase
MSLRQRIARIRQIEPRLYLASMSTRPLSKVYGFDRGSPVDRRYIERFLTQNARFIRGRCIEVKDSNYLRRFGAEQVISADVLDINADNPCANVVGDLQDLKVVADASYDCAVVTNTLQYLRDPRRGVCELHRILAAGGTALVTLPCLGRPGAEEFTVVDGIDYWRFMPAGVSVLFADLSWEVDVTLYGNALVGMAMWYGMAVEDLPPHAWRRDDAAWPCVLGVRGTKP